MQSLPVHTIYHLQTCRMPLQSFKGYLWRRLCDLDIRLFMLVMLWLCKCLLVYYHEVYIMQLRLHPDATTCNVYLETSCLGARFPGWRRFEFEITVGLNQGLSHLAVVSKHDSNGRIKHTLISFIARCSDVLYPTVQLLETRPRVGFFRLKKSNMNSLTCTGHFSNY